MDIKQVESIPWITHSSATQVLVVGGGPSGVCAAVAAARQGSQVTLVEQAGTCGGMATQALVGPFMTCYDKSGMEVHCTHLKSELEPAIPHGL